MKRRGILLVIGIWLTWSVTDSDEDALNPLEWLLNKILEFFKKLMDFFG